MYYNDYISRGNSAISASLPIWTDYFEIYNKTINALLAKL